MSTEGGAFAVLAMDHLHALSSAIRPDSPHTVSDDHLAETKVRLFDWLADQASGVLLDPILGLQSVADRRSAHESTGLLIGLEDGDYAAPDREPRLFHGWDVQRAKAAGADAIKCSFLYDPFAPSDAAHGFVTALVEDCERADLPLFAEPLAPPTVKDDRRRVVVETARNIGSLGVDILKLESPMTQGGGAIDAEWLDACVEVTEASSRPWTLLSAGEDFENFARQFAIACEGGASGYVVGRSVWQDLVARDLDEGSPELEDARLRLARLTEIAENTARPWPQALSRTRQTDSEVLQ